LGNGRTKQVKTAEDKEIFFHRIKLIVLRISMA
jgi:hypothetical protein